MNYGNNSVEESRASGPRWGSGVRIPFPALNSIKLKVNALGFFCFWIKADPHLGKVRVDL